MNAKHILAATAIIGAVALAGCGGTASPTTSYNTGSDPQYTESQVASLAGFQPDETGIAYRYSGCDISVIMTSPAAIKLYADAGDAVVTNPAGTAGVKFSPEPYCREALLKALQKVK